MAVSSVNTTLRFLFSHLSGSSPSLTAETQVRFQYRPYQICGGRSDKGKDLLRVLRFSPATIIPPTLYTNSSTTKVV
jgi:hypothetical protein